MPLVKKRAIDVTPMYHAFPGLGDVMLRRWSEDGKKIMFGFDCHLGKFALPDEEIEVYVLTKPMYNSAALVEDIMRRDRIRMGRIEQAAYERMMAL